MNQSHWTLFIFLLGCLLVMYFYLYLSTEFRHIVISTETGTKPRDYILINRILEGIRNLAVPYIKYTLMLRTLIRVNGRDEAILRQTFWPMIQASTF